MESYLTRRAEELVREAMIGFRVIVVNGPRQSGKSTLLDFLRQSLGAEMYTLDDTDVLRSARTDPTGFIESQLRPLFLDEVQRGGDQLILAIKAAVDRAPNETGAFILAGSSRFLTVPTISESLAGRVRIVDLWPFTQGEIGSTDDHLVNTLFNGTVLTDLSPTMNSRPEIMERVVLGGFPPVHKLGTPRLRRSWFEDYRRTMIQRDLRELSDIRHIDGVSTALNLLAARTAQELNVASVARDGGLGTETLRNHLALLETIYFHHTLRSWSTNRTSRTRRRPKVHLVDSGMAADLNGLTVDTLADPLSSQSGAMLETFVANEIVRQAGWADLRVDVFHYRDREQREVDVVLESGDGRVVGIEVKAARDVHESDFRWLKYLRDRHKDRFVHGVVLHLGRQPLPFGPGMTALPVSALWSG